MNNFRLPDKLPDQADVVREFVNLKAEIAKAEMKCAEAGVDAPVRPELKGAPNQCGALENCEQLRSHVAALKPKAELADAILAARIIKKSLDAVSGTHSLVGAGSSAGSVSLFTDAASSPSTMNNSQIAALVTERDALKLQTETLTADRDALRLRAESAEAKLSVVEKESIALRTANESFSRRLASDLAKFGIRATAVELPPDKTARLSATDKVLMSK